MAEINSFPNNSDEYIGAEEVMRWLHGRTKGVYGGTGNAAVSAVANSMSVSVAPGIGWITDSDGDGICWWSDSAITLTIDAAESTGTLNRIDRVIVEWKTTDYSDKPEIKVLKGTNASTASAPSLTNSSSVRQISLARISIPAGTTSLAPLNIIDERMDETVCGIVTETVTADTSMIVAQYEEALQTLLSAISQAWSGAISDGSITREKLSQDLSDEIGVSSVNGESGAVVLDAEDIGAMEEWDLLWENASLSSAFAAQDITLNLSGYDFLMCVYAYATSTPTPRQSNIFPNTIGTSVTVQFISGVSAATAYVNIRSASISETGIHFSSSYRRSLNATAAPSEGSGQCIPVAVYGIKGLNG